jgi:DHA1 family tetracycline resistance protein-like MFS transporter
LIAAAFALVMLPESLPREAREDAAARRLSAPSLLGALRRTAVRPVLLLFFIGTLSFSGLEATFALFGEHEYGIGPRGIGYLLAYVGVIAAIMQAGIVGVLARRFGERVLILAGFLILAAGMIYCGTSPVFGFLLAGLAAIAVGNGMVAPSLAGLVSVASTAEEQGGILGVYQSLGSLARATGPFLGGLAFDHLGPGSPLWGGGIVIALASLIALELPRRARRTP